MSDIAELLGLESADVFALLRDEEAPQLRHICFDRQFVQGLGIVVLFQDTERPSANDSKFCLRADTPMLWKRLSVPIGLEELIMWQPTQRALPLNRSKPRWAAGESALLSPPAKRSNGASRKIKVRSKLAMARPRSS